MMIGYGTGMHVRCDRCSVLSILYGRAERVELARNRTASVDLIGRISAVPV